MWSVLCYAALGVVLKDVSQHEQVLNGSQTMLKHLGRALHAQFVHDTLVLPTNTTFATTQYSEASIEEAPSCNDYGCAAASAHPCDNAIAETLVFEHPISYGLRVDNSHSLPSIAVTNVPGEARFLPLHLLTFDNCRDCYGECAYQKLTVMEDHGCSCVRVKNSNTWILNATDLILPRAGQDVTLQTTSTSLQFSECVGDCNPQDTIPNTMDAEGANLANAMGRGIPREHIPQLQPADASDVHECQSNCNVNQCLMWTWNGTHCAHLFELSPDGPPPLRAFDVMTSLRWQGYNTSAEPLSNNWPPLSNEPYKYGLSAPAVRTHIADCKTIVNQAYEIKCKIEAKAWCAQHWLCGNMPCRCNIQNKSNDEDMLARMIYYNMGFVVDISAFDASAEKFYEWVYDGGALHSNLPLYTPAFQTTGFQNRILKPTDTTFFNPYVPLGLEPPAGIVPGAPWSNVMPTSVACPEILAPEDVYKYEPAVAAYMRVPSGVGPMPRYKSPTLSTIACNVNVAQLQPAFNCSSIPLWQEYNNKFFALNCCGSVCSQNCTFPYPEPMPFESINDCDGTVQNINTAVNEAALILPPWVSTSQMYSTMCSNHSRKESWEGCDQDADCTFFGTKTGQYQLRRAGTKTVQCFKTDHVLNAMVENLQEPTISTAQAVQHVQKHVAYGSMRNAHAALSPAHEAAMVVRHNHTNNTAQASHVVVMASNNASVVRVGKQLYCSANVSNCTAGDILLATPMLQLRAKREFVSALQRHDNAAWLLVDQFAGSRPWQVLGYDPALECDSINANCTLKTAIAPATQVLDNVRVRLDGTMIYGKRKQYAPKWRRCLLRAVSPRDQGTERYAMHVCGGVVCTHGAYAANNCSINRYNLATFRAQALRGEDNRNVTFSNGKPGLSNAIRRFAAWLCRISRADWACETYDPLQDVRDAIATELRHNTSYAAVQRPVRVTQTYNKLAVARYPNPHFDIPLLDFIVPYADKFETLPYETHKVAATMPTERVMLLDYNRSNVHTQKHPHVRDVHEPLIDTFSDNTRVTQLQYPFAANDLTFAHPASFAVMDKKRAHSVVHPAAAAVISPVQAALQRTARTLLPYAPPNSPVRTVSVPSSVTPEQAVEICASAMCAGVQLTRKPAPSPNTYTQMQAKLELTDPVVGQPLPPNCQPTWDASYGAYGCGSGGEQTGRRLQEQLFTVPKRNLSTCEDGSAAILGPFGEATNCSRDCALPPRAHGYWPSFKAAPNHVFSGAGKALSDMLRNCPDRAFDLPTQPTVAVDGAQNGVAVHVGNVVYDLRQNVIRASNAAPGAHARAHMRVHAPTRGSTALACRSAQYAAAQQQLGSGAHLIPGEHANLPACIPVQRNWSLQLMQDGEVKCKQGTWRNEVNGWVSVRGAPIGTWAKTTQVAARSKAVLVNGELYVSSSNGTSLQASQHYVRLLAASSGSADHTFIAGVMAQGPLSTQCAAGAATVQAQNDWAPCQTCVFGANWSAGVVPHNGAVFEATGPAKRVANAAVCAKSTNSLIVHFYNGTCTPGVAKQGSGLGLNNVFRAARCMVNDCSNKPVAQNANATRLVVSTNTQLRQALPFGIPGQQNESFVPNYAIGTPALLSDILCVVYKNATFAYNFEQAACNGLSNIFQKHNFATQNSKVQLLPPQRARAPAMPGNFFGCTGQQPSVAPNLYLLLPKMGADDSVISDCPYATTTCTYTNFGPRQQTSCSLTPNNVQLSPATNRPQFFGSLPVVVLNNQECEMCAVMLDETTALGAVPCASCTTAVNQIGFHLKVCRCKNYVRTTQCASVQNIQSLDLVSATKKQLTNFAQCFDNDVGQCASALQNNTTGETQVTALAFMWQNGRLAAPQQSFKVENGRVLESYVALSVAQCAQKCAATLNCATWQLDSAYFDETGQFKENNCSLLQGGILQNSGTRFTCPTDYFINCSISNATTAVPISFAGIIDNQTFATQVPAATNSFYGNVDSSQTNSFSQVFVCAQHLATAPAYYVAARFLSGEIPVQQSDVTTQANCTGISFMVDGDLIKGAWYRLGSLPYVNNLQVSVDSDNQKCASGVKWQGIGYAYQFSEALTIAMNFAQLDYFQVDAAKHAFRVSKTPCDSQMWFRRTQTPKTFSNPQCSLAFQQNFATNFWPLELQTSTPINISSVGTRDGVVIKLNQDNQLTETRVLSSDDLLRGTANSTAALATAAVQEVSSLPHPGTLQCTTAMQNIAQLNSPFSVVHNIRAPDDCCAHCVGISTCTAYTWDESTQNCELFAGQSISFAADTLSTLWGADVKESSEAVQAATVQELVRMLLQSFTFTQRILGNESTGFANAPAFVPAGGVIALDASIGSSSGVRCSVPQLSQIAHIPNYLRFMFPGVPMSTINPCNSSEAPPLNANNKIDLKQFPFTSVNCEGLGLPCMAACVAQVPDVIGTLGDCSTTCKCVFKTPALQNAYTNMLENAKLGACSDDTSKPTLAPPDGGVVDSSVVQGMWQSSISGDVDVVGTITDPGLRALLLPEIISLRRFTNMQDKKIVQSVTDEGLVLVSIQSDSQEVAKPATTTPALTTTTTTTAEPTPSSQPSKLQTTPQPTKQATNFAPSMSNNAIQTPRSAKVDKWETSTKVLIGTTAVTFTVLCGMLFYWKKK